MTTLTMDRLEQIICMEEAISPEGAGLLTSIIYGTATFLSEKELADLCDVPASTVKRWTKESYIEAGDMGGGGSRYAPSEAWRVYLDEVKSEREAI